MGLGTQNGFGVYGGGDVERIRRICFCLNVGTDKLRLCGSGPRIPSEKCPTTGAAYNVNRKPLHLFSVKEGVCQCMHAISTYTYLLWQLTSVLAAGCC